MDIFAVINAVSLFIMLIACAFYFLLKLFVKLKIPKPFWLNGGEKMKAFKRKPIANNVVIDTGKVPAEKLQEVVTKAVNEVKSSHN